MMSLLLHTCLGLLWKSETVLWIKTKIEMIKKNVCLVGGGRTCDTNRHKLIALNVTTEQI